MGETGVKSSGIAGDPQCLLHTADHRDLPWSLPALEWEVGGESRKTVLILPDVEAGALPDQGGHQVTRYTLQEAVPLTLAELLLKLNNGKRR